MWSPRFFADEFLIGLIVLGTSVAYGQDYPSKPIRVVTSAAGGPADLAARLVAQGVSGPLGQPVVVDNRGSGIPAAETVAKALPDGHTLLFDGSSFWITPLLQKTPYDVVRDFLPISQVDKTPSLLVVHPTLPVKNVKELIALAKARPGELNYASSVIGSQPHLTTELFKSMAGGVNIVRVPYKGGAQALNDLASGVVQMMFASAALVGPYIKSGRVRALAVTSAEPSLLFPGLPTVAASGLPGYESAIIHGVFAPAKTPAPIITRLNQEIVRLLVKADVQERFLSLGGEAVSSSPQELAAAVKAEVARIGKVIEDNGIRSE